MRFVLDAGWIYYVMKFIAFETWFCFQAGKEIIRLTIDPSLHFITARLDHQLKSLQQEIQFLSNYLKTSSISFFLDLWPSRLVTKGKENFPFVAIYSQEATCMENCHKVYEEENGEKYFDIFDINRKINVFILSRLKIFFGLINYGGKLWTVISSSLKSSSRNLWMKIERRRKCFLDSCACWKISHVFITKTTWNFICLMCFPSASTFLLLFLLW